MSQILDRFEAAMDEEDRVVAEWCAAYPNVARRQIASTINECRVARNRRMDLEVELWREYHLELLMRAAHSPIRGPDRLMAKVMTGTVTTADIHRLPCAECPSMHGHDPETADTVTWPIADQDKTVFRCFQRSNLCKGYADLIGFSERVMKKEGPKE